jgi:hypothetical protein
MPESYMAGDNCPLVIVEGGVVQDIVENGKSINYDVVDFDLDGQTNEELADTIETVTGLYFSRIAEELLRELVSYHRGGASFFTRFERQVKDAGS